LRRPLVGLDEHDASLLKRHLTALLDPLDRHLAAYLQVARSLVSNTSLKDLAPDDRKGALAAKFCSSSASVVVIQRLAARTRGGRTGAQRLEG
jgi:hypothetical protein